MRKFERKPKHEWLSSESEKKCKKWGAEWEVKRKQKKRFSWRNDKENFRTIILPLLREMTKSHCSFCDFYPMESGAQDTVEHFVPKSGEYAQPKIAYKWSNLYLACRNCQAKGSQYSELLLKPDATDYEFRKYFDINPTTGDVIPSIKNKNINDYKRAKITIDLYKFNRNGKPKARLETLENYQNIYNLIKENSKVKFNHKKDKYLNFDKRPYRFFIEVLLRK